MTIPLPDLSAFELVLNLLTLTCLKKLPVALEGRSLSSVLKRKNEQKRTGISREPKLIFQPGTTS